MYDTVPAEFLAKIINMKDGAERFVKAQKEEPWPREHTGCQWTPTTHQSSLEEAEDSKHSRGCTLYHREQDGHVKAQLATVYFHMVAELYKRVESCSHRNMMRMLLCM